MLSHTIKASTATTVDKIATRATVIIINEMLTVVYFLLYGSSMSHHQQAWVLCKVMCKKKPGCANFKARSPATDCHGTTTASSPPLQTLMGITLAQVQAAMAMPRTSLKTITAPDLDITVGSKNHLHCWILNRQWYTDSDGGLISLSVPKNRH